MWTLLRDGKEVFKGKEIENPEGEKVKH